MWKYSEEYNGHFKSRVYWIIPFLLAYGVKKINNKVKIHSLHILPFFEITFSYSGTLNGSKQIK